jgi:hypothetical protein
LHGGCRHVERQGCLYLKDGGIAVVPKQDGIAATATTLSQFCDAYPRATLRFLTRKEMLLAKSVAGIVQTSSARRRRARR